MAKAPKEPKTTIMIDQPLPTMEDIRIPVLDNTFASIASVRADLNALKQTEKGLLSTAMKQMQAHLPEGQTTYKSSGVEGVLTHTDKLRVRLIDDDQTSGGFGPEDE